MAVRLVSLGSGSEGNATLVEFGRTRILVDAGLSARALARRLDEVGVETSSLAAVLLSHEHHDHARGAEVFSRRHGVPVFSSLETLEALDRSPVHFSDWHALDPGRVVEIDGVRVDAFPIPHDAARPVGFVLESDGVRAGIVTDLGHATTLVAQRLRGCQILVIESNHDDAMLHSGPYPWQLKQRVGSRLGHLSNDEAARLLAHVVDETCEAVVLAHLSARNNTPELARSATTCALRRIGRASITVHVAERRTVSAAVEVG
jgi:phosphoribosyl 1,2-cyclic phosphodiesterase